MFVHHLEKFLFTLLKVEVRDLSLLNRRLFVFLADTLMEGLLLPQGLLEKPKVFLWDFKFHNFVLFQVSQFFGFDRPEGLVKEVVIVGSLSQAAFTQSLLGANTVV